MTRTKASRPTINATFTTRLNGNGEARDGWYVTHGGTPIGRPYGTQGEARAAAREYAADLSGCLRGV